MLETELLEAIDARDAAAVRQLLARGANVEARTSSGHTALMAALFRRCDEIIELLLRAGANAAAIAGTGQSVFDVVSKVDAFHWIDPLLAAGGVMSGDDRRRIQGRHLTLAAATGS